MLILCVVERQQLSCHYAYGGGGQRTKMFSVTNQLSRLSKQNSEIYIQHLTVF